MKKISLIKSLFVVIVCLVLQSCSSSSDQNISRELKSMEYAMSYSNELVKNYNIKMYVAIKRTVEKAGSRPADMVLLNKAESIRKECNGVYELINNTKIKLLEATGGYVEGDSRKEYLGADDEMRTEMLMLGPGETAQGEAYSLKKNLDECTEKLSKVIGRKYPSIAIEPSAFKGNSMSLVMAKLTQLETMSLGYENSMLADIAAELGVAM